MTCKVISSPLALDTPDQPHDAGVRYTIRTGLHNVSYVRSFICTTELTEGQLEAIEDQIDIEEGMEMLKEEGGIKADDLWKELGL